MISIFFFLLIIYPTSAISEIADDDSVLGDLDAPVTIIEFSDYECPFCGRHYSQTYPKIIENYVVEGGNMEKHIF